MKIGKKLPDKEFNLGEMKIGYCEKYEYLGVTINNKNNIIIIIIIIINYTYIALHGVPDISVRFTI